MRHLIQRLKRAFYVTRAWLWVRLRRDVPVSVCLTGNCWCVEAEQCAFRRCGNCDGCVDAAGKHIDTGKWVEEWNRCPVCGGGL